MDINLKGLRKDQQLDIGEMALWKIEKYNNIYFQKFKGLNYTQPFIFRVL